LERRDHKRDRGNSKLLEIVECPAGIEANSCHRTRASGRCLPQGDEDNANLRMNTFLRARVEDPGGIDLLLLGRVIGRALTRSEVGI
jgi:hypothetical protein